MEAQQVINIPIQWIPIFIQSAVFIFSGIAAVVAVIWKLAQHERRLDDKFTNLISSASQINGDKIQRVYARMDEYKNFSESTFVRRDMCGALHSTTANAVAEMKVEMRADIKALAAEVAKLRDLILKKDGC